ncbi:hypothetical protein IEO21_11062 [Rhodonia placenta]|uniref:Uncharacterized protein n=1 Tax=Rhodonia placenta TaxID=104341 RepID=A0A8H7TWR2_9APHY|nr:hypothetical protein IEO21_11062 [Postia placenta]
MDKRSKLRSLGQQRHVYIQGKFRGGCVHWSVYSWSVRSMLTQPWGVGESAWLCQWSPSCATHCRPI